MDFNDQYLIKDERDYHTYSPWESTTLLGISKYDTEELTDDSSKNWERYRRILGATLDDIDIEYSMYRRNPQNHPQYEIERDNFFERRFKNLQKDHIGPFNCDFEIEWSNFWETRVNILYKMDVENEKLVIKQKLHLPCNKECSPSPIRRSRSMEVQQHSTTSVILLPPKLEAPKRHERRYSKSPEYVNHRLRNEIDEPQNEREPLKPLNVISVLSQLTILEEELGSLGPKALEFHSAAMLFEKENRSPANELLKKREFYIFFVTAKEKLKGRLSTNIVEVNRMKLAASTVSNIQALLDMFENHIRQNARNNPLHTNESELNSSNLNNQWSTTDAIHGDGELNFVNNDENSRDVVYDYQNNCLNELGEYQNYANQHDLSNLFTHNSEIDLISMNTQYNPFFGVNTEETEGQDNNVSWLTTYLNSIKAGDQSSCNKGEFNASNQCNRKNWVKQIGHEENCKNLNRQRNLGGTGKNSKKRRGRGFRNNLRRKTAKKSMSKRCKA